MESHQKNESATDDTYGWRMVADIAHGKLNDYFNQQERATAKELLADKRIYMKKAMHLMRTNPDINKQYHGRLMDLIRDIYEKTAAKAAEMALEPTIREILNTSAAYVDGAQAGRNIANI